MNLSSYGPIKGEKRKIGLSVDRQNHLRSLLISKILRMFPKSEKTYKLNHLIEVEIDSAMNKARHMNAKIIQTTYNKVKAKFYGVPVNPKQSKTQRQQRETIDNGLKLPDIARP